MLSVITSIANEENSLRLLLNVPVNHFQSFLESFRASGPGYMASRIVKAVLHKFIPLSFKARNSSADNAQSSTQEIEP